MEEVYDLEKMKHNFAIYVPHVIPVLADVRLMGMDIQNSPMRVFLSYCN